MTSAPTASIVTVDAAALLADLARISVRAGARIMEVATSAFETRRKADGSLLTAADLAAEAVIGEGLRACAPGLPVVSEEDGGACPRPPADASFLLVDPLDGTREFLGLSGEFTVNIALMSGRRPVCGVVYAPALSRLWLGTVGEGAAVIDIVPGASLENGLRRPIRVRPRPAHGLTAVASRSHIDPATTGFLDTLPVSDFRSVGSSLKFCLLAEGEADVYPRFGPTMEWDTAAGQAVLEAAGGTVRTPEGAPFLYGKVEARYRNGGFVAWAEGPPDPFDADMDADMAAELAAIPSALARRPDRPSETRDPAQGLSDEAFEFAGFPS